MSKLNPHLASGILVGMGIMIIILGFWGWFSTNYVSGTLSRVLEECGIDTTRHFIFTDLNGLMHTNVVIIVIGFVSLLAGVINERLLKKKTSPLAAS